MLIEGACPSCNGGAESWLLHREVIALIVLGAVVVVGFVLTRAVATTNRELRARDAAEWYERGRQHLAAGRSSEAVRALRRASTLDGDVGAYRLALADALAGAGDDGGARQVLVGIRDSSPESPDVNVRLAELEARTGDVDEAVRYYQSALHGAWATDQDDARRHLRLQFIRYLLSRHQRSRALSELIVLTGNLPDDPVAQREAGQLLLDAGEPARALELFGRALGHDGGDAEALAGAGVAAFETGDYATAQRYLSELPSTSTAGVEDAKAITELVLSGDPLRAGLRLEERRTRLVTGLDRATARVDECLDTVKTSDPRRAGFEALDASARALAPMLTPSNVRRSPDIIDTVFGLVFRIEQQTAEGCGPATPLDRALLLIGRRHGTDQ